MKPSDPPTLRPSNRGSATILALLVTGVIITVGIGFNWIVKEHLKAAEGMRRKSEAMVKAFSAYNALVYSILAGNAGAREIVFSTAEDPLGIKSIPLDNEAVVVDGDVELKVQDSNGMISLDGTNLGAMGRLLRNASPEDDKSAVVINSYLDWISKGNSTHVNGAGDAYYASEGKPYATRHYPVQYKKEFALLRGMDSELYKKISPFVTLLPATGFNPNTASDEVLMAYLNIDSAAVQKLRTAMSNAPVSSNSTLSNVVQRTIAGEGIDFFPSTFLEITINVGKPDTVYSLKTGIDTRWNPTYPYSVIYWENG
jgi:general secretion pathway protein K